MRTFQANPPLPPPLSWDSLSPTRQRRLLALLGAMVVEALRASTHAEALHTSTHAAEVKDECRQR